MPIITTSVGRTCDRYDRPCGYDWWIHVDQSGQRRESYSSLAAGPALPSVDAAVSDLARWLAEVEHSLLNAGISGI
jgi:hypothetical protein